MDISLYKMQDLVAQISTALINIWSYFTTPIIDLVQNNVGVLVDILLDWTLFPLIQDMTLLELMLTSGIMFYLVYQFVTWALNVLT